MSEPISRNNIAHGTLQAKHNYDFKQRKIYLQASRRIYRFDRFSMFSIELISGKYGMYGPVKRLP